MVFLTVGATALALCAQVVAESPGSAAPAASASSAARQSVIVVLKDQLAGSPASRTGTAKRHGLATSAQDAVLGRLSGAAPTQVKHYTLGNAFAATVTAAQASALASDPSVQSVVPDATVALPDPIAAPAPSTSTPSKAGATTTPATDGPGAVCPSDPSKPLLEPEALTSIDAYSTTGGPSASDLANGSGVTVGFLADNMDPNYPDFIRPDGSHVFTDYRDFSGDGPNTTDAGAEAFGDASSIAAQGVVVHDLSNFVNQAHPLPPGCNIIVKGVAPGANLVGLNVFGGTATNSAVLQAIDYAVTVDHVDVLNESLGLNQYPDASSRNLFQQFNDMAVAAGVTVTTSSGDAGVTSTIGSPATDPLVISAGATTDNRLYAQTTYAAFPFSNGKWISDNISALSSSGVTQNGRTIDLVAPGEGNWADCAPAYAECRNFQSPPKPTDLESFGGTSESAPLTAGVAALVIQAYRRTHSNFSPTPALVKQIITGSTTDLGLPADEQGTGLLNARNAVEAALTAPRTSSAPSGLGSNITLSADQATLVGAPGTNQTASFDVTNIGAAPTTVTVGTRRFVTTSTTTGSTAFDAKTLPTFTYYNGTTWAYKKITFTVPANTPRFVERIAWAGGANKVVRMTLLAPDGTFVANSRPQGGAATPNYANVDVRAPAAGTWTAVLYSSTDAAGYTGNILTATDIQRTKPVGTLSATSLRLDPGQTRTVRASVPIPSSGGQAVSALTFTTSSGHTTTAPVIARSLISGDGKFTGTITGGNARAQSPAQTFSYEFDVPAKKADLDINVSLTDPGTVVDGVLIDPNGEVADVNSNVFLANATTLNQGNRLEMTVANPLRGRWQMVIVAQNPVTGKELEQPFTGKLSYDKVKVSAPTLPTAASTKLAAGQAVTVPVKVSNTSVEPMVVGVDPRTDISQSIPANVIQGSADVTLPESSGAPIYLVPPDTSQFTLRTDSSLPAQVEAQSGAAGLDVLGDLFASQNGSTSSVATIGETQGTVSKGIWFGSVQEIGPFGPSGAPSGSAHFTATYQADGFDSTVTSSTGDPFDYSVDPNGTGGSPTIIQPGQSAKILVTITPSGPRGTVVTGHLNLVTEPVLPTGSTGLPFYGSGEVVSVLPYKYRTT